MKLYIHEKLLDSDWLVAVQFKCNPSANIIIPDCDWLKDNKKFSKPIMVTKILCRL